MNRSALVCQRLQSEFQRETDIFEVSKRVFKAGADKIFYTQLIVGDKDFKDDMKDPLGEKDFIFEKKDHIPKKIVVDYSGIVGICGE